MKLGQVININSENLGKNYPFEKIKYVDISSVGEGIISDLEEIKVETAPSRAKRIVRSNNTIISTVRPQNRSFYYFKDTPENIIASTGFAVLSPKEDLINGRYLFYVISDKNFTSYLANHEKGSAYPAITTDIIFNKEIILPPLHTQKRIASILSAYDNLIENNLKRIKLLEETAQNIYKEWFVNFRFPNFENTPFNQETGLPEGWEIIPFSKCADFINGFAFKPHHHSESGLPIIKIKELKNGLNSETPRYKGEEVPEKYFFTDDTILFSWSADINVYWWANGESILNQHLFKVVPFENVIKEHFYFGLKNSVPDFLSRANGATMKHIKRGELDNVNYTKPNDSVAILFQKQIKPILQQLVLINSQNQKLKEARDILLPRLMNRTIEV